MTSHAAQQSDVAVPDCVSQKPSVVDRRLWQQLQSALHVGCHPPLSRGNTALRWVLGGDDALHNALRASGHKSAGVVPSSSPASRRHVHVARQALGPDLEKDTPEPQPSSWFWVEPSDIAHIVEVYKFAQRYRLSVGVVGGGHSDRCVPTTAPDRPSIVISMALLRSVTVADGTVSVLGGARQADIAAALDPLGLCLPLGSRPSVGMGLMLHGGIGHIAQHLQTSTDETGHVIRFASDTIVAATLVLPSGQIVHLGHHPSCPAAATTDENAQRQQQQSHPSHCVDTTIMFEALRGAGSILGCVFSVTFACRPFPPMICRTKRLYPLRSRVAVGRGLQDEGSLATSPCLRDVAECHAMAAALGQPGVDLYAITGADSQTEGAGAAASSPWLVTQEFAPTAPLSACGEAAEGFDSTSDQRLEKMSDVFDAEYHRYLPKAARDFKRSVFVALRGSQRLTVDEGVTSRHEEHMFAQLLRDICRRAPTSKCYVHVVSIAKSGTGESVAPVVSALSHLRPTHCVVLTGRWDLATQESEVVDWVYTSMDRLLALDDATASRLQITPYAIDLGPTAADVLLLRRAFPAATRRRMATLHRELDDQHVVTTATPFLLPPLFAHPAVVLRPMCAELGKKTPQLLVAVCGVASSGKSTAAAFLVQQLRALNITARHVSISQGFKERFAAANGLDAAILADESSPSCPVSRTLKDKWRASMTQAYSRERHEAEAHGEDYNYMTLHTVLTRRRPTSTTNTTTKDDDDDAGVLIVTGMREPNVLDNLRATGIPFLSVLIHRPRRGAAGVSGGGVVCPSERHLVPNAVADGLGQPPPGWDLCIINHDHDEGPAINSFAAFHAELRVRVVKAVQCALADDASVAVHPVDAVARMTRLVGEANYLDVRTTLRDTSARRIIALWCVKMIRSHVATTFARSVLRPSSGGIHSSSSSPVVITIVTVDYSGVPLATTVADMLQCPLKVWSKARDEQPPYVEATHVGSNITNSKTVLRLRVDAAALPSRYLVFVDDTIASGRTLAAMADAMASHGWPIRLALFAFGLPLVAAVDDASRLTSPILRHAFIQYPLAA